MQLGMRSWQTAQHSKVNALSGASGRPLHSALARQSPRQQLLKCCVSVGAADKAWRVPTSWTTAQASGMSHQGVADQSGLISRCQWPVCTRHSLTRARALAAQDDGSRQGHAVAIGTGTADRNGNIAAAPQPMCIGTSPDVTASINTLLKYLFTSSNGQHVVVALGSEAVPAAVRIIARAASMARRRSRCLVFQAVANAGAPEQTVFYVQVLKPGWPVDTPEAWARVLYASRTRTAGNLAAAMFKDVDAQGTACVQCAGGATAAIAVAALVLARNSLLAYRQGKDFAVHVLPDRQSSMDGRGARVHVLRFVLLACEPGRPALFVHWRPPASNVSPFGSAEVGC